ncbi:siphovirus Gp157 family protein [Clostridium perfringens]|uniref:siphovirus Gp157 family protein n=1 Tax=Clostridium perfringens TaxID=1502 RepID=UPI003D330EA8
MAKLYELANNYRNLTELIDREDVEQDLIQNALKECQGDIEEKVDNIVKLIRNTESDIEGYKAEEKRLNARRKSLENTVTSLKNYLDSNLKALNLREVKTKLFSCKYQKSKASVEVLDQEVIPREFIVTEEKVDKKKLYEALKAGQEVEGASLKENESLRIK